MPPNTKESHLKLKKGGHYTLIRPIDNRTCQISFILTNLKKCPLYEPRPNKTLYSAARNKRMDQITTQMSKDCPDRKPRCRMGGTAHTANCVTPNYKDTKTIRYKIPYTQDSKHEVRDRENKS